ncbi:acid protease [Coniochaeta sp. PMI_546]|nr:acid protease [Coniochaeta sp. PMI_546]
MRIDFTRRNVWHALFVLVCQTVLLARVSADCGPYPINVKIGNVTLSNKQDARGLSVSVGSPEQNFAFLPQWPLNNTMVYGTSGFCELRHEAWTETGCVTFRGGEYTMITSQSRKIPPSNAYPVESAPYPQMSFVSDTIKLNDNHSLTNFPMGIALSGWGEQGYHPQMAIGMGANSTMLNMLKSTGRIASRVFGIFWGRTGATSRTQLDGSMVFGGYDRAKVIGQPYTQFMIDDRSVCSTGMAVTITDLVLNFANGSNVSLFPGAKTSSIAACLVPDYPVLMTMPLDPYFNNIRIHTGASMSGRSFGIDFFSVRYDDTDTPYQGDLTIKLQSGLSVRIPNDQLVVPDKYSDSQTGQWIVNSTDPAMIINAIQQVNANDLSQIGRQFLSAAYLMVNQETNQFTLWAANPTSDVDLVAFDANGKEADSICPPASTNTTTGGGPEKSDGLGPPAATSTPSAGLSTGVIAGIAVGAVAVVAIAVGIGAWCYRRKKVNRAGESTEAETIVVTEEPKGQYGGYHQGAFYKSELPDTSGRWPRELSAQGPGPQAHIQYELMGSVPEAGGRNVL